MVYLSVFSELGILWYTVQLEVFITFLKLLDVFSLL